MEKIKTIVGAIITALLAFGVLFKIMHWPGAGMLIVLSASSLAMYVVIAAGVINFQSPFDSPFGSFKMFKSNKEIAGISASILIVGLLFKIQHWPGAGPMLVVGFTSIAIVSLLFIYSFFTKKEPMTLTPSLIYITFSMSLLFLGYSSSGISHNTLIRISETAISIENNIELINEANTTISSKTKNTNSKVIYEATEDINHYINDLKSLLYQNTDYLSEEMADTISLTQIMGKDNYDMPTLTLGLADPTNPRNGEFTASELKHKIKIFNEVVSEVSPESKVINTEDYSYYNGELESWETSMFYHNSLSQVILTLNQIQLEANIICNTILTNNLLQTTNTQQPDTIN